MPGESSPRSFPKETHADRVAEQTGLPQSDIARHASADSSPSDIGSSPSDSGSSPSDSGSTPSPSTPQKLLPSCTSPFGPRLIRATPSSSAAPRPQPEGSDHRHGNTVRLSGRFGGHGPCGRHSGPVKMERIKVLMGSEVESDYKQPEDMETRVVMGQEALLKTKETLTGKHLVGPSSQAIPLPGCPVSDVSTSPSEPQAAQLDTGQENSPETANMEQEQGRSAHFTPLLTNLLTPLTPASTSSSSSSSSSEPVSGDVSLTSSLSPLEAELSPYGDTPYLCTMYTTPPQSEPAYPAAILSFTEPPYIVDPMRVGVPSSLDPDLYYTAPSTPIKMAARPTHLTSAKHRSYPGSPASPLSPNTPSDSEDLCSPLTSPSGSYVTAEGSWTSYTSSTSPCTSPNLLLTEEAQEAPACFVSSLSEIGDEVGEERGTGAERGEDRGGGPIEWRFRLYKGLAETVILEEEETLRGDERGRSSEEVKVSRGSCRPRWVTEDTSPLRSSSGRSTDSQEEGGESESSLCPVEDALAERQQYSSPLLHKGLELELQACVSEELYPPITSPEDRAESSQLTFNPDLGNFCPQTSNLNPASLNPASLNPSSLNLTRDTCSTEVSDGDNSSPYGDMGPFLLFPCSYSDGELEEEETMIPASLLNFPLHTSLLFQADSMEITLFPREEEGDEEEQGNSRNEGNDVDAYAAGEEEGDVEDDDDDDEEDDDEDVDAMVEVKVEIAIEEEVDEEHVSDEEEDEEEGEGMAVNDPPQDDDTSASFLHSLSETSINEGQTSHKSLVTLATETAPGKAATDNEWAGKVGDMDKQISMERERDQQGSMKRANDGQSSVDKNKDVQSTNNSQEERTEQTDRDSFKLLIKSDTSRATQATCNPCTPLPCVFGVAGASGWAKPLLVSEIELKNQDSSSEEVVDSRLVPERTTATNDLNKGVPLLLYPKESNPNLSNIPVSCSPEGSPEVADNLSLTPDLCPTDPAQENLRENTLSTEDGVPGALSSSHTPLAVSPKRENSETDAGAKGGAGACAWGGGETLSLSLGRGCELEAESLLLCEADGQRVGQILSGMSSVPIDEDEVGVMGDEDDNNSLCGRPDKMADVELVGEGVPESNLSSWKSIEEISEAGGGEDGSSRFPEDDVSNLQSQSEPTEEQENNDSVFLSSGIPTSVTLNALSEEAGHQSVCLCASISNIPLTEAGPQVAAAIDWPTTSTDNSTQQLETTKALCSVENQESFSPTVKPKTSSDRSPGAEETAIPRDLKLSGKHSDLALSLQGGAFGSFSPKISKRKSGSVSQQSYSAVGKDTVEVPVSLHYSLSVGKDMAENVKKLYSQPQPEKAELKLFGEREDGGSQTTDQPKTSVALEGQIVEAMEGRKVERQPVSQADKPLGPLVNHIEKLAKSKSQQAPLHQERPQIRTRGAEKLLQTPDKGYL
ncbi:hypothetical protein DPEC_G00354130 [Dallia pectoralis]|uniref:Uncharacterized protein n=1 Tax=Dallia pectoralis TaxID=75939 RepID=A0ACC2F2U8_DALPE|nr:hypothetical protein DPEC_G00354130 [Dallia pectoralis]